MSEFDANEFVGEQHSLNIKMFESLARIEQSQKDTTQRLFGGEGQVGILPYMAEQAKTVAKEAGERVDRIEGRTTVLESWKKGTVAWTAGAIAVLTFEAGALAFYFNSVASHLHAALGK